MTHAYNELNLSNARNVMATMFDYVANDLKINLDVFMQDFIRKGYAKEWEKGNFIIINGGSGYELAQKVIGEDNDGQNNYNNFISPSYNQNRTKEYWCGNVLAYYQWYSDKSFKKILEKLSIEMILRTYATLHEADISKFVEMANDKLFDKETNLQKIRKIMGLSQIELSNQSGVPVFSIRAYEKRRKNIRKAEVETIIKLSKTLNCKIEDILD